MFGIGNLFLTIYLGVFIWSLELLAVDFFCDVSNLNGVKKQSIVSVKKHSQGLTYSMCSLLITYITPYIFVGRFASSIAIIFGYITIVSVTFSVAFIVTIHHYPKQSKAIFLNLVPLLFEVMLISYVIF